MNPELKEEIKSNLLSFNDDDWALWIQSMTYVGIHYPHLKTFYTK